MASFPNGGVLTNQGNDLKAKTDAGVTLELRRLVMGDGVAEGGTDLKTLTALVNQTASFDINSFKFLGSGRTQIRTILSNAGMVTGFWAKELGLIAYDPDVGEILYTYAAADPSDWIPPETESFQQIFDVIALTGSTQDISVTLAPNIATVTREDMNDHEDLELDPTDTNTDKVRHLSNAQGKKWEDHTAANDNPHDVTQAQIGYTAADVLEKLKTVDGAGSGQDADLLDGKQLSTIESEYQSYVSSMITALIDSSPAALDTLNELAAALGDDPNFATTITNLIATKLNSSAYTAADVLAKLLTVDGAGTGLDADLLDGKHAAEFAASGHTHPDPVLTVSDKGIKSTTGTWTLTELTPYKPLFITADHSGSSDGWISYRVTGGGYGGQTGGRPWVFYSDDNISISTPSSTTIIPTATTVTISILGKDGTVTLRAWQ